MDGDTDGLGSVGKRLVDDLRELARLEVSLAKTELASKARHAAIGIGLLVVAGLSAFLLLATLAAAAILGFALVFPAWASALIVAGILALLAVASALVGAKVARSATPPVPNEAIETTKENVAWLRTQLRSVRK